MAPFRQNSQRLRGSCNAATANAASTNIISTSRHRTRGRSDFTTRRRSLNEQMRRARGRSTQTIDCDGVHVKSAATAATVGINSGKRCKPAAGRVQKKYSCDVNGQIESSAEGAKPVPAFDATVSSKPETPTFRTRYSRRTCAGLGVFSGPSRDVSAARAKETAARDDNSSSNASESAIYVSRCSDKSIAGSGKVAAMLLSGEESSPERRRLTTEAVKRCVTERGKSALSELEHFVGNDSERGAGPAGKEGGKEKDEVKKCEIMNTRQRKQDDPEVSQNTGKEEPVEQHFAETLRSQAGKDQKQWQGNRSAEGSTHKECMSIAYENKRFQAEETEDGQRTKRHSGGADTCAQKRNWEEFLLGQISQTDNEFCKVVSLEENGYELRKRLDVIKSEAFLDKSRARVRLHQMKENEICKLFLHRQAHTYCDNGHEKMYTSVSHKKAVLEGQISTFPAIDAAPRPQTTEEDISGNQRDKAGHFIPRELSLYKETLFGAYKADDIRPPRGAEKATEVHWRMIHGLKSQDLQGIVKSLNILQEDVRGQRHDNEKLNSQENSSLKEGSESRQEHLRGEMNHHYTQAPQILHHPQTQHQLQMLEQHFDIIQQQQEKSQLAAQNAQQQLQAERFKFQHQTDLLQQNRPTEENPRHGTPGEVDYPASGRVRFFLELPKVNENGITRRRGVLASRSFLRTGWRLQNFVGKLFQMDPEAVLGLEDEQGFLSPFDGEELAVQHGGTYTIVLAPLAGAAADSEKQSLHRVSGDRDDAAAAAPTQNEEYTRRQKPAPDSQVGSWKDAATANRPAASRGNVTLIKSPITYERTRSVSPAEEHQLKCLIKDATRQKYAASAALSRDLTGIAPSSNPATDGVGIYEGAAAAALSMIGKNEVTFSNDFSTPLLRRNDITMRLGNTAATREQDFADPDCVCAAGLRSARQTTKTGASENRGIELACARLEPQLTSNNVLFCGDGKTSQQSRQHFATQTLEKANKGLPRCENRLTPLSEKSIEALKKELLPPHQSRTQQTSTRLMTHRLPIDKADTQQYIAMSDEHIENERRQQQQQQDLKGKKKIPTQELPAQCKRIRERQRPQEWSQNEQKEAARHENRRLGKLWVVSSSHGGVRKKQVSSSATNTTVHDPEEVARRQKIAEQHVRAVLARISLKKALQENLQKNGNYGINLRRLEYEQKEFSLQRAITGLENRKQPTSPGGPLFLLPLKSTFQRNCTRPICMLTTAAGKRNDTGPTNLPRIMDSDAAALLQHLLGNAAAGEDKPSSNVYTSQKAKDLLSRNGNTLAESSCHEDALALASAAECERRLEQKKEDIHLEVQGQQQHTDKPGLFICKDDYSDSALPQGSHTGKQLLHIASCVIENLEKKKTSNISMFDDMASDSVRLTSCALDPSFGGSRNKTKPSTASRVSLTTSASSNSFPSKQKLPSTFQWNVAAMSSGRVCLSENGEITKDSCEDSVREVETEPVASSVAPPRLQEKVIRESLIEKLLKQVTWQDLQKLLSDSSGSNVEHTANLRASFSKSEECSSETTESAVPAELPSSVELPDHLIISTAVTSCDERERSSSTKSLISGDSTAGGVEFDCSLLANAKEI